MAQSRATAARKLAAVRTFLRYLRREELIDGDPGALVATPKREVRMPAHLSENEMTALVDAPDASHPLGRRDRAILELFYASGLRLSELAGLDLDDVNLSARMVASAGKGREGAAGPVQHEHGEGAARVSEGPRRDRSGQVDSCEAMRGQRPTSGQAGNRPFRPFQTVAPSVRELSGRHG